MSKIFLPDANREKAISNGWEASKGYNTERITAIEDGHGAQSEITSIPSPLARLNLVKESFAYVNSMGHDGNTIYHKMVAEALDIAHLFFHWNIVKQDFKIIKWNKAEQLKQLSNLKVNGKPSSLSKTLELFFTQVGTNWDRLSNLFLLKYLRSNRVDNVIVGGTSPDTLFFSSFDASLLFPYGYPLAGDLLFSKDKSDDPNNENKGNYLSLFRRTDREFVEYLYSMRRQIPNNLNFPEFGEYLRRTIEKFDTNDLLRKKYNRDQQDFPDYNTSYEKGENMEVCGMDIRIAKKTKEVESQFKINVEQPQQAPILVPMGRWRGTTNLPTYTASPIDTDFVFPYSYRNQEGNLEESIDKIATRTIPNDGREYPCLFVNDIFEPYLIKVPHALNSKRFVSGISDEKSDHGFLVPVKSSVLDYLGIDFFQGTVGGVGADKDKKNFEMEILPSGDVKTILRIRTLGGFYIKYERVYSKSPSTPQPNAANNEGFIIEYKMNIGIMPFFKYPQSVKSVISNEYRVILIDNHSKRRNASISATYIEIGAEKDKKRFTGAESHQRNQKDEVAMGSTIDFVQRNFDAIEINLVERNSTTTKGLVIPIMIPARKVGGNGKFSFAIDFGTTNTFVAYSSVIANQSSGNLPFSISKNEIQFEHLWQPNQADPEFLKTMEHDFKPQCIEGRSIYKFPIRTSISHSNNEIEAPIAMVHNNIPFYYEKESQLPYNSISLELKWADDDETKNLRCFIESLVLMMRNKVLLGGGDLMQTKIIWFYPLSMNRSTKGILEETWSKSISRYFGEVVANNLTSHAESLAPFFHYNDSTSDGLVTIDIGGGTTDFAFWVQDNPLFSSSVVFAGNAIFGDGLKSSHKNRKGTNGFAMEYVASFQDGLKKTKLEEVFKQIKGKESHNIINFLFSLSAHPDLLNAQGVLPENLDVYKQMGKKEKKPIFILFYTAIIYHIAKIIRNQDTKKVPRIVAFSGNGSSILNVLDGTPKKTVLKEYTQAVFEKVLNKNISISIKPITEPKKATCYGGLNMLELKDPVEQNILPLQSKFLKDKILTPQNWDNYIEEGTQEMKEFIKFFSEDLWGLISETFSVEISDELIEVLSEGIEDNISEGIKRFDRKSGKENYLISQSPFFYHLHEALYNLSKMGQQ